MRQPACRFLLARSLHGKIGGHRGGRVICHARHQLADVQGKAIGTTCVSLEDSSASLVQSQERFSCRAAKAAHLALAAKVVAERAKISSGPWLAARAQSPGRAGYIVTDCAAALALDLTRHAVGLSS